MVYYNFNITSTSNSLLNLPKFLSELSSSPLSIPVVTLDTIGTKAKITLGSEPSPEDINLIESLIALHNGLPDPEETNPTLVDVVNQIPNPPFANKVLSNGKKIFKRKHGLKGEKIVAESSSSTLFEIPYNECKITGLEIIGGKLGDQVSFSILDTDAGTITGQPNYVVNNFGFGVYISENYYEENSNYDADLIKGLKLKIKYFNNGSSDLTPMYNIILHEVK